MRTEWRDGDRVRTVELRSQGGGRWSAEVAGAPIELAVEVLGSGRYRLVTPEAATIAEVTRAGARRFVRLGRLDFVLERDAGGRRRRAAGEGAGLESPMPGLVTRVMVEPGDGVVKGQPLLALEAMKMEHLIRAPRDGRIRAIGARAGEMVDGGVRLVELDEPGVEEGAS